jgi:hypothetical protein
VDDYTRFCAVLTPYAESDFDDQAAQYGRTFGCYQQNPTYWPSALLGTREQCKAFILAFQSHAHTGSPVRDCWAVQRWDAPDPATDLAGFFAAPETINYLNRVPAVAGIILERKLP